MQWPVALAGVPDVYVCVCHAVCSKTVREIAESGARTVRQVADACGAGRDCGQCVRNVRAVLDECHGPRLRGRIALPVPAVPVVPALGMPDAASA